MMSIHDFLRETSQDTLIKFTGADFRGTASPDGSYEFNVWLSENRLKSFKELVRSYMEFPDSMIHSQSSSIPWDEFRAAVVNDPNVPMRETVLEIIDMEPKLVPYPGNRHIDHRLLKLKALDKGKIWDYLRSPILSDLRYGDAIFYFRHLLPMIPPDITLTVEKSEVVAPDTLWRPKVPRIQYDTTFWMPKIYLKSNLIGWAAASANVAAEFDLAPHWSFVLPWYYSAVDYFKSTIKFRNFTLQPEARYWPNAKGYNHGFFVGLHAGAMAYNFAIDGKYRYQDRKGRHPALGGGLAIGFRKALSKNQRWHVEFTAGAGCYYLDYDVFENTPNYKEGEWVRRKKKTWFGLDQLAINFSYNFPLTRKRKVVSVEEIFPEGGEL